VSIIIEAYFTSIRVVSRMVVLLLGLLLWLPSTANAGQTSLALVSARDHIEGSMLTAQSVYADETRIYLATVQGTLGTLFVLSRDRAANFPVLESIPYTSGLYAVRGDSQNVYVAAGNGNLLVYRKDPQLTLLQTIPIATYFTGSLAVTDNSVFVGIGLPTFAVNESRVYLAALNEGDRVIELSKSTLTPVQTYGDTFEPNETVVFDRQTGARVGTISSGYGSLYGGGMSVIWTKPGCCGPGIFVYDAYNLALDQFIERSWTNTVVQRGGFLIAGNESGNVDLFDFASNPSPLLATSDLRQLTGHTGSEDIEIRALWADNVDNLIFAGSSWGNDQSRGPLLPSFFVLEPIAQPAVWSVTPANGAIGVSAATQVSAGFTGLIDAATLSTSTFVLRNPANVVVASTVTWDAGVGFGTLTPQVALASLTTYTATITGGSSGVKDLAGNGLASDVVWSFITADTTRPTVTSVTPASGATGVSAAAAVTATFSEAIDATTITPSSVVLRDPANAVVAAMVSYTVATHVTTLTPSAALAGSTTYTATIAGGSSGVKDVAGNALASNLVWSFTTVVVDTTPPTVIGMTPASGASGVSTATAVTATFSEPINAATLTASTFVLRNPANAVVTAAISYNAGTRVGTLTPSAPLTASTTYTATITGGSAGVKDTAGNALASAFVRSFTTTAAGTLGLTTIGSLGDSSDSNVLNGSKVRTSAAGRIVSMSVYVGNVDALVANRRYQLAIYTNNGGRPGTLVATSATGTLVANAWNTLGVSASLQPSTSYWLVFNTNGRSTSVNNMRYNSGTAGQGAYSSRAVPFGTWPTTFPAATIDNQVFSLFAVFGP
jgi:hypothetical protein